MVVQRGSRFSRGRGSAGPGPRKIRRGSSPRATVTASRSVSQQAVGVITGLFRLQLLEKFLAGAPRLRIEPALQLFGRIDQWIGATAPALLFGLAGCCWPGVAIVPCRPQAGKERRQRRHRCLLADRQRDCAIGQVHQLLLRCPDIAQQPDGVEPAKISRRRTRVASVVRGSSSSR